MSTAAEVEEDNGKGKKEEQFTQKNVGETLISLTRLKRVSKTKLTKLIHHLEELCLTNDSSTVEIESVVETLWSLLEKNSKYIR